MIAYKMCNVIMNNIDPLKMKKKTHGKHKSEKVTFDERDPS